MTNPLSSVGNQRLPFATYDLVVYLGGGASLFALFMCYFDVSVRVSSENDNYASIIGIIIATVGSLFVVYVIGHSLAFVASMFVEGLAYSTFGYPSKVYQRISSLPPDENGFVPTRQEMRKIFLQNSMKSFSSSKSIFLIRALALLPVAISGISIVILGFVGFATPKLPRGLPELLSAKIRKSSLSSTISKCGPDYFKIIEHHAVANNPSTFARMYNYLTIYGLLRSGVVILTGAFWMEINQIYITKFSLPTIQLPSYLVMHQRNGSFGLLMVITFAIAATYFCYIKFNRRYFEEAMLGFCLKN